MQASHLSSFKCGRNTCSMWLVLGCNVDLRTEIIHMGPTVASFCQWQLCRHVRRYTIFQQCNVIESRVLAHARLRVEVHTSRNTRYAIMRRSLAEKYLSNYQISTFAECMAASLHIIVAFTWCVVCSRYRTITRTRLVSYYSCSYYRYNYCYNWYYYRYWSYRWYYGPYYYHTWYRHPYYGWGYWRYCYTGWT